MEIGDKVRIDGMTGTIVALISEGKFAPAYPANEWSYLKAGLLVETIEAGLIHYPNLDDVRLDEISN